ncbi:hypothetical protein Acsp05_28390 [Actinokineospora sp. NBRC 105648]|nr:hypothetical protein Acsp05_28390 [Actinokineospora sp. NBRC 105648]
MAGMATLDTKKSSVIMKSQESNTASAPRLVTGRRTAWSTTSYPFPPTVPKVEPAALTSR